MNKNQYSISADSGRWWWASAAAGTAAAAAVVVIPMASSQAIPPEHTCFMGQSSWHDATAGPQPVCGTRPSETRSAARVAVCPPPPDVRYVGVPWVPPEPTGCRSIDRWWTMVDRVQG